MAASTDPTTDPTSFPRPSPRPSQSPSKGRVVQWAQEHGEVGGVLTSHRQMTAVLRAAGHEVTYVDTGSGSRAARAMPSLWRRRALHVLHITRLARAAQLAPVLASVPGRSALVLHSGSTAGQISAMSPRRARAVLGVLRTFDELWVVNAAIREVLPPDLAARTTVVTPFDARGVGPREALARDPHALVVATNAGLAHYNARVVLEALPVIREAWPDVTLRVLAYGRETPDLAVLRAEAAAQPAVQLSFDLDGEQVSGALAAAGVFLRPTSWDGDSVIVREALALGCRVVASDLAPRPRGVELAAIDPASLARVVLHGGARSDGAGLVDTTLAEVATRALAAIGG
jgi:glycosyltransferase involved in cell wall biosynthesis